MTWGSIDAFVAMGGYGLYVWGSYAVTALAMIAEVLLLGPRRRNALRALRNAPSPHDEGAS